MHKSAIDCLDAAVKDAANTNGNDGVKAIGVAFLPVYANVDMADKHDGGLEDVIAETIANVQKWEADLIAWSFPKRMRKHKSENHQDYLPGVILLAKTTE